MHPLEEVSIEWRFFNELHRRRPCRGTQGDLGPSAATYFDGYDVERSIHLTARSEARARAIVSYLDEREREIPARGRLVSSNLAAACISP